MRKIFDRIPAACDWIVAIVAGIGIYSLNVTTSGDPLSGVGLSAGPTSAGILESGRTTFYGALVIAGAVLAAASFLLSALGPKVREAAGLGARSFGGLAFAGVGGLLLDYRDGPVAMVHLAVYVLLVLGAVRFVRISAMLSSVPGSEVVQVEPPLLDRSTTDTPDRQSHG